MRIQDLEGVKNYEPGGHTFTAVRFKCFSGGEVEEPPIKLETLR